MRAALMVLSGFLFVALPFSTRAAEMGQSPINKMSRDQLIKLARSAAPASISKDATIMLPGEDGKLVEAEKGTNGFTCVPDVDGMKVPDPFCGDEAAMQWADAFMSGAPKPTNTVPGIAYMGKGGWRFEKDGKILMDKAGASKVVRERPHWMVFWPFDKSSGLPTVPGSIDMYIMWEGTPYAHLMVFQDPTKIK